MNASVLTLRKISMFQQNNDDEQKDVLNMSEYAGVVCVLC